MFREGGIGNDLLILNLSNQTNNLLFDNLTGGINAASIVTATGFEQFNITGGSGNDGFIQSGLLGGTAHRTSDSLNGGLGNDTLNAGLGLNDTVMGGTGDGGSDHFLFDINAIFSASTIANSTTRTGQSLD